MVSSIMKRIKLFIKVFLKIIVKMDGESPKNMKESFQRDADMAGANIGQLKKIWIILLSCSMKVFGKITIAVDLVPSMLRKIRFLTS